MFYNLLAITLLLTAFVMAPSSTFAQEGVQDGSFNQAPTGNTTNTTDDEQGFDWRWLLPLLLAVPLLFMFRRNDDKKDRSQYQDQSMAGSKGGESGGNRNNT